MEIIVGHGNSIPTNRYLSQPKQGNAEVTQATPTYGGWGRKFRRMGEK
jgi:hypothetical protein